MAHISLVPLKGLITPHAHAQKGLSNQFCLSVSLFVCLSVCQSSEKFLNLNTDRVKRFPKLTVPLTL